MVYEPSNPEPTEPFNGKWKCNGDFVAKSTAINLIVGGRTAWDRLDFTKIRTRELINPHTEQPFTAYCLADIAKQARLKK